MKKLMLGLGTVALLALTFASCELIEGVDLFDGDKEGICDFVYPITLVMPDDGIVTVNDEDELDQAYEDWYNNNPTSTDEPALQYPLDIINSEGETVTVNTDEELEEAFADCWDDEDDCGRKGKGDCGDDYDYDKKDCFEITFPISFTLPDGTAVTANDEDELWTAIENYYDANPNNTTKPVFNFPIEITWEDGTVDTLFNDADLEEALDKCGDWDDWGEWEECFDFVYPLTVVFPDNTTASVNDDDALETAIENWYDANPNATTEPTFSYPISITYDDGTTAVINSDTELENAYDNCD